MTDDSSLTRILIIDEHTLFCEALRSTLEAEENFTVVGAVQLFPAAIEVARDTQPDIVIMDAVLSERSVTNRIADIEKVSPASRVIILTRHDDPVLVQEVTLRPSVRAYLLKSTTRLVLIATIHAVQADAPSVIISVSPACLTGSRPTERKQLSEREHEVIMLVAQGMTNGQIARKLCIAEGTVKRHLRNSFTKLDAVSRIDAVNKAMSASLIAAPGPGGT
ncbi:response regulator transcription factor [Streptomyces sp. NPDC006193]|uniref:response regulator transcription factor n=1 Tax=Streptomyces sp. NPDC006193 TaxID=3155717 RepID=UPI0033BEFFF9